MPVAVVSRATPAPGNEASFMQQLLGDVGKFSPTPIDSGRGKQGGATQPGQFLTRRRAGRRGAPGPGPPPLPTDDFSGVDCRVSGIVWIGHQPYRQPNPLYGCRLTQAEGWAMQAWHTTLDRAAGPLYRCIADAIGRAVARGELKPGDRLPPHRILAVELGVDLTTVTRAYTEARRRGLLDATVGSGTFVSAGAIRAGAEAGNGAGVPGGHGAGRRGAAFAGRHEHEPAAAARATRPCARSCRTGSPTSSATPTSPP